MAFQLMCNSYNKATDRYVLFVLLIMAALISTSNKIRHQIPMTCLTGVGFLFNALFQKEYRRMQFWLVNKAIVL